MKYDYCAELYKDGSIMTLYRSVNGSMCEEYVYGEGWKSTVDAFDAVHGNGEWSVYDVEKDVAEEYVKKLES